MDDLSRLADDLDRQARTAGRQTRGIMARHLDGAAAAAKDEALSSWTKYGRGEAGSAGTIRARMSRTVGSRGGERQLGYVLADGQGAFQAEHGKHDRAPDPVIHRAVEAATAGFADDLAEQLADFL